MPEERKLVTVLFADLVGSTALGQDNDPEVVRGVLSVYFERVRGFTPIEVAVRRPSASPA